MDPQGSGWGVLKLSPKYGSGQPLTQKVKKKRDNLIFNLEKCS